MVLLSHWAMMINNEILVNPTKLESKEFMPTNVIVCS